MDLPPVASRERSAATRPTGRRIPTCDAPREGRGATRRPGEPGDDELGEATALDRGDAAGPHAGTPITPPGPGGQPRRQERLIGPDELRKFKRPSQRRPSSLRSDARAPALLADPPKASDAASRGPDRQAHSRSRSALGKNRQSRRLSAPATATEPGAALAPRIEIVSHRTGALPRLRASGMAYPVRGSIREHFPDSAKVKNMLDRSPEFFSADAPPFGRTEGGGPRCPPSPSTTASTWW